jgi:AAHS family 4-hydroxybenzoate transporter-like MFS transporter
MGHSVPKGAVFTDRPGTLGGRASIGTLFRADFVRDSLALWFAFFSCLLAVYLGLAWVPSVLTGAGFSSSAASTGITAFNLGGVAGALIGGVCIARWGSRVSMLLMTALAVASAGVMSLMEFSPAVPLIPIVMMLTLTGGLINGVQTTMYALAAHVYPAAIRATGVGSAVSFGRIGAVLSGYIGAGALEYAGAASFFGVMATMMAVCFVALAIVRRHVPSTR